VREGLEGAGIETVSADLLAPRALASLPDAPNVLYMAARKFGSTGQEHLTWAMNALLPALVAERYPRRASSHSPPAMFIRWFGGRRRRDRRHVPCPGGEYAQSALGRERIFEFFSRRNQTPMVMLRLIMRSICATAFSWTSAEGL